MGRVFLSHNHADKPFVRLLAADVKALGVQIWLDELELKPGDSLILSISKAIGAADYVLAFLSPHSIKSNWVTKELAVATTLGINGNRIIVIPLLLRGLESNDIPMFLIDQLYVDFRQPSQYDSSFKELLRRLKPRALPEKTLSLDTFRKDVLVAQAQFPGMREWVINYLITTLPRRTDPTERYWSYIALGEIGGDEASNTIQLSLSDSNEFARRGAHEAWRRLMSEGQNNSPST
jgi:hypothetical protein